MATLYKRENGTYYIKAVVDGKEIRRSLNTKSRKEAQKMRAEAERQIAETQITGRPSSDTLNFKEAWDIYHAALLPHKKYQSLKTERFAWNLFSEWCQARGIRTLQSLKVGDVAQWQAALLAKGRATAGVNNRLRMCKVVINHLIRLEAFTGINPFSRVKGLKEDNKVKFLPWEKVLEFVELSKGVGQDIHLVFVLGAFAGLRKDEILRARWEHVDWDLNRMWIDGTKSSASSAYVPNHKSLRDALEPYRAESGYIVRPEKEETDAPNSYRWEFGKQWARVEQAEATANKENSVGHVTPHQLRHSVATHLLDIGYNLQQVAVFLRHSSDIPTRKYANLKGVRLQIDRF